jgi:hypothetical protein
MARHSEVFESMFLVPQPLSDVVESMDGCQVVRMFDSDLELSNLIIALYDGASVIYPLSQRATDVTLANLPTAKSKTSSTWPVFCAFQPSTSSQS